LVMTSPLSEITLPVPMPPSTATMALHSAGDSSL